MDTLFAIEALGTLIISGILLPQYGILAIGGVTLFEICLLIFRHFVYHKSIDSRLRVIQCVGATIAIVVGMNGFSYPSHPASMGVWALIFALIMHGVVFAIMVGFLDSNDN